MLKNKGSLITSPAPSGDAQLLYGDKTKKEKKNEKKVYKEKMLNEINGGE